MKRKPLPRSQRAVLPLEELRQFSDVFGAIKANYVENVEDKKLITEAINGMLQGLDPHSAYLDQEAFKEMQVGTQGEFGGLGIEVGMEDGFVRVISPIDDTPASRAGVLAGDLIVKIDDNSVKGMSLNDAVKQMRGRPNTQIRLTIVRKGEDIGEGPLLDLLLDYDALAPRILQGALADVLVQAKELQTSLPLALTHPDPEEGEEEFIDDEPANRLRSEALREPWRV